MVHDDGTRPEPPGPGDPPGADAGATTPGADAAAAAPGADAGAAAPGATGPDAAGPGEDASWPPLTGPLRTRLAEIAGTAVGGMPLAEVPAPLRRLARFTPAKRARLGATALVTRLERDGAFRAAVVAWWAEHRPGELELPARSDPAPAPAGAAGPRRAGSTPTDPDASPGGSVPTVPGAAADPAPADLAPTDPDAAAAPGGSVPTDSAPADAAPADAAPADSAPADAAPADAAPALAPDPVSSDTGAGAAAAGQDPLPAPVDKLDAAAVALLTGDPYAAHRVAEAEQSGDLASLRAERDEALARADKAVAELERVRAERDEAREQVQAVAADRDTEYQQMRRRVSDQGARLRTALDARAELEAELERLRSGVDDRLVAARTECESERERADRERRRADAAAREVAAARQAAREARRGDEVRLELLLDTIGGAVSGLRRELDVGAGGPRPADLVRGPAGEAAGAALHGRAGVPVDGLAALDTLLGMPSVHLVVDGYNVSKTGYPDLPLADQRSRLVTQLGALGARTGVEVTVVFDGAAVSAAPLRGGRGVRVLFSDPGVTADDVIRDLVAAEPSGRPLLVATSDQEVVRSVRRRGAHSVPSAVLLRRLGGG